MSNNDHKEKDGSKTNLVAQIVALLSDIVLDTPEGLAEVIWRVFSVMGLSSVLISSFLIWRHPEFINGFLTPETPSPLLTDKLNSSEDLKVKVMENISSFLYRSKPQKIALVGWPTATTGVVVWDTGGVSAWPVKLNGLLSLNLVPSVGPMVFKECWHGSFNGSNNWLICPIHNDTKAWAFVITQWENTPTTLEKRSLRHLTEMLENLIY